MPTSPELVLVALEGFDVEDDGSAEWQYVIDLAAVLSACLHGNDVSSCVQVSLLTYLEGTFNVLANEMAVADGKPISQADAVRRLAHNEVWQRAIEFVRAL